MPSKRIGIIGGGIVGIAIARQLASKSSDIHVTIMEKESQVATHQTAHNSGVIHAGVYYQEGSLKAQLCSRGAELIKKFCAEEDIQFNEVGKLVVATTANEVEKLDMIEIRAVKNGVPNLRRLKPVEFSKIEPSVVGLSALYSPTTSVVNYRVIANRMSSNLESQGHSVKTNCVVDVISQKSKYIEVHSNSEVLNFDHVIVAAGLGTSVLARRSRTEKTTDVQILPFRGEFYTLIGKARNIVNGLVYPVPDPRYPFLGVHFTKSLDGGTFIGPNAVLALALEGYTRGNIVARDIWDMVKWPGTWRMARQNWFAGIHEVEGSLSKRIFVNRARRYVPELNNADVVSSPAGVRAQAVDRQGRLIDDFLINHESRLTVLYNVPSPAATSCMAIAEYVEKNYFQ
jgi:L-2-hydroxyglutarate oxidase LhgO